MNFLKKLPIKYVGELHDIRLVNFTVDMEEVLPLVPTGIKVRDFGGKALISMVDVKLKKMHPEFITSLLNFKYRHVAFRLLVDDSSLNKGEYKGIYFLKSFTNRPHIVWGGKILTNYNLEIAQIKDSLDSVNIKQGKHRVVFQRDDKKITGDERIQNLKDIIGSIDRAYSVVGDELTMTRIVRKKWPIEPVECAFFENTFFKSAELQGVFKVNEVILYNWLPAKAIKKFGDLKIKRFENFKIGLGVLSIPSFGISLFHRFVRKIF